MELQRRPEGDSEGSCPVCSETVADKQEEEISSRPLNGLGISTCSGRHAFEN